MLLIVVAALPALRVEAAGELPCDLGARLPAAVSEQGLTVDDGAGHRLVIARAGPSVVVRLLDGAGRELGWRTLRPLVKDCKTPSEAAQKLNVELFPKLKVKYSTERKAPNQSPHESIAQGKASCTGLSIVLADACRSVGVPARLVGTPLWANKRGNHTWVEVWDKDWHFTGACEQDPQGLDRGWFVADAAQAKKDVPEHAIYAASFKKTETHFPLVWARRNTTVPAENVTDRYAKPAPKAETARVLVRVVDAAKKRVAVAVTGDALERGP